MTIDGLDQKNMLAQTDEFLKADGSSFHLYDYLSAMTGVVLGGYRVSDTDSAGTPKYYGFLESDGKWYIMREETVLSDVQYRYAKGNSNYTVAWTGRVGLSYDYYDVVF